MLDPTSPMPLYQQLKIELRRSIEAGVWKAGEAIPPERELMERYRISRITVRQALADLEGEGLLHRRHGKGTFVAPRRGGIIAESLSVMTGHLEELQLRGLDPQVTVLELDTRPMPPDVAQAMHRPEGSTGWYFYRLVRTDAIPLMLSEVYLPTDLYLNLDESILKREGMSRFLLAHGYVPARGLQRIAARVASHQEATLLEMSPGEAVLDVTRVIIGPDDRPLVWFRTKYRGDRYEYEVDLKRRS
jgi:GntR family transcriptional regulator